VTYGKIASRTTPLLSMAFGRMGRGETAMRMTRFRVVAALAVVLTAVPVAAHHAFSAEFDEKKPIKLVGTVGRMDWMNPHCWLQLQVTQPDGTVVQWMVEGGAPNALLRRGWTKRSLLPGTEIVVEGYRSRDGALKPLVSGSSNCCGRPVRCAASHSRSLTR